MSTATIAHPESMQRFWGDTLEQADPEVAAAIRNELNRQRDRKSVV